MESTPVSGKDGTEGSSQDNLLHAAKALDEGVTSSSSGYLSSPEYMERRPRRPSYYRIPEPRKSLEIQDGGRMTNQYVPGRSVVIIRPRATSSQVNPQDEEIAEEEAVCKVCFYVLKEKSTLKTVCKCKNALIHEKCATKWIREKGNNCDVCGEKVKNFPVTLLRGSSST